MRALRVIFPIVFGIAITFGIMVSLSLASTTHNSPVSPNAKTVYVDVGNSLGTANGESWATAYTDLQDALAVAQSGDQIWVATGVYTPGNFQLYSFNLVPGVALYGGFDPAGGFDEFSERDWKSFPTILSGDIDGDDTNTAGVVLTTSHIVGGNSYFVVNANGTGTPITGTTILDGFIITAGSSTGLGGGLYCDGTGSGGECSPRLTNLTFSGNWADIKGGAMYNRGYNGGISSPSLDNVTFTGNSAGSSGGGIYNFGNNGTSSPTLTNVAFSGNSAGSGGALYSEGSGGSSKPNLSNVVFSGNSAKFYGGAMYNTSSSPTLKNVTFSSNNANVGGAMYNDGSITTCSPSMTNIILWGNTANTGSQIYNTDTTITITTSLVEGGLFGLGVHNINSTVTNGGGNLSADPLFVRNPNSGMDDYGDLRLQPESPAVDTGTNSAITLSVDLDGTPRKVDGDNDGTSTVDMGAYEFHCPAVSTLYVDHTASGNGSSWIEAKPDLALGLNMARACANISQVWVATGVYIPGDDQSDSFNMASGVAVYGGFDPAGSAEEFSQRDWQAYPTILSGDIGGDDTNTDGVVLTTTHIVGPNSYHVVMADGTSNPITNTTLLDGFTITAGQAKGGGDNDYGGGFYCDGSGSGAECSPTLINLAFSGNEAGYGGAMYSDARNGTSIPTLNNITFSSNSAVGGGGIFNWDSSPSLENVTFSDNSALTRGGAIYNYTEGGTSSPRLVNVTFSGNSTKYRGGAIFNECEGGTSSPTLDNVTFSGNSAGLNGGAIYNYAHDGGTSSPRLSNVTFSGNSADNQGGAMFNNGRFSGSSSPSLSNIILWGNTAVISGSQMYNLAASPVITTSLVDGGIFGDGVYNEFSTVTDGGGNLDSNPIFVRDPDPGPDGAWNGVDDDYGDLHLQPDSPAIDTGTNSAITLTIDLDGSPRKVDGDGDGTPTVDMGAYEYNCPAGSILYVDHNTAIGTGSSWADAKPDLAQGLELAVYCPHLTEVWVATGVYTPGILRSDSFNLPPGVAIYGGFDPAGSADEFSERDRESYPTILSGDIAGDDTNTAGVVLTTTHIIGSNSYHVVIADSTSTPITSTTILDGFIITAGQSNSEFPDSVGGGFYCIGTRIGSECSPNLGGITFTGNDADYGGALYNHGNNGGLSSPSLVGVIFSGNSASRGGAIYNNGSGNGASSPSLENVTFTGNFASTSGGAMYNNGYMGTSNPTVANAVFSGNKAVFGGAINNDGYKGTNNPILTNVTFSGNSADYGGAMYNNGALGASTPSLNNIILWGNTATTGSQMYNNVASVAITTSLVEGGITGTGVYNFNTPITDGGGNLDANPDFVRDPDPGPDGNWDGVDDDYGNLRLGTGSPAIDTGTNSAMSLTVDLDGYTRILDGDSDGTPIVDMGAYEYAPPQVLTVILDGSGGGTVTGPGINCFTGVGADCTETYPYGTIVTISATADPGSTFTGWGGSCSVAAVCEVTMDATITVTVTFTADMKSLFLPLVVTR